MWEGLCSVNEGLGRRTYRPFEGNVIAGPKMGRRNTLKVAETQAGVVGQEEGAQKQCQLGAGGGFTNDLLPSDHAGHR